MDETGQAVSNEEPTVKNKKGIGKGELIALIVSSCIGTGIFGITKDVAQANSPRSSYTFLDLCWIRIFIFSIIT